VVILAGFVITVWGRDAAAEPLAETA
jgi:hypothetical protein